MLKAPSQMMATMLGSVAAARTAAPAPREMPKSPIFVDKRVIESSSVLQQAEDANANNLSNVSPDKWAEILEKMSPDDFKYKM